jgi:hypothetical protein
MATTTDAHKLLLDGAWIETRDSIRGPLAVLR